MSSTLTVQKTAIGIDSNKIKQEPRRKEEQEEEEKDTEDEVDSIIDQSIGRITSSIADNLPLEFYTHNKQQQTESRCKNDLTSVDNTSAIAQAANSVKKKLKLSSETSELGVTSKVQQASSSTRQVDPHQLYQQHQQIKRELSNIVCLNSNNDNNNPTIISNLAGKYIFSKLPAKTTHNQRQSLDQLIGHASDSPVPLDATKRPTKSAASNGKPAASESSRQWPTTSGAQSTVKLMDMGKRLLEAAKEGETESVRQLVVNSNAPFTSDWLGVTALHMAASNGHAEIVDILLKAGVNRDARTKLERTALHHAAQGGSLQVVDLLLIHGSDLNARDMLKMTPIHWAVERKHIQIVERFLLAGADLTLKSKFQLTPIDIAQQSNYYQMIELFRNWIKNGPKAAASNLLANACQFMLNEDDFANSLSACFNATPVSQNQNQQHQPPPTTTAITTTTSSSTSALLDKSHDNVLESLSTSQQVSNNHHLSQHQYQYHNYQVNRTNLLDLLDHHEPCIVDLVELEWNTLKFEPDFFLTNDGDDEQDEDEDEDEDEDGNEEEENEDQQECPEARFGANNKPKVEYLKKIVEELQKENRQLRQKVEQLSTSPSPNTTQNQ